MKIFINITFGRRNEDHTFGMFVDQSTNHVNLFQSELNGVVILGWTGRVRRPELKQINERVRKIWYVENLVVVVSDP